MLLKCHIRSLAKTYGGRIVMNKIDVDACYAALCVTTAASTYRREIEDWNMSRQSKLNYKVRITF
jgi:hypothetical protein